MLERSVVESLDRFRTYLFRNYSQNLQQARRVVNCLIIYLYIQLALQQISFNCLIYSLKSELMRHGWMIDSTRTF